MSVRGTYERNYCPSPLLHAPLRLNHIKHDAGGAKGRELDDLRSRNRPNVISHRLQSSEAAVKWNLKWIKLPWQ
jgi:hypothetical protein